MHILFYGQAVYESGKNGKKSYLRKLKTTYSRTMVTLRFNDEVIDNIHCREKYNVSTGQQTDKTAPLYRSKNEGEGNRDRLRDWHILSTDTHLIQVRHLLSTSKNILYNSYCGNMSILFYIGSIFKNLMIRSL